MPTPDSAPRRVRQIDLARATGLSRSAVSMALSKHPSVAAETVRKVEEAAQKLGYAPDPGLSALAAYRATRKPKAFQSSIVLVSSSPILAEMQVVEGRLTHPNHAYAYCHFSYMQEAAHALGYQIEFINIGTDPVEHSRWSKRLASRGVRGVLVRPGILPTHELNLEWDRFSVIDLAISPSVSPFHQVVNGQTASVYEAMRKIAEAGYRRPALWAYPGFAHDPRSQRVLAAYRQSGILFERLIEPNSPIGFNEWVEFILANKVDVALGGDNGISLPRLRSLGVNIPAEVGYADFHLVEKNHDIAGIYVNHAEIARQGVIALDNLIRHSVRGLPTLPWCMEVPGTWVDGFTLPPKT
jgi:LacI family transcriptional regulator